MFKYCFLFGIIAIVVTFARASENSGTISKCNFNVNEISCAGNIAIEDCACKCCIDSQCNDCSFSNTTTLSTLTTTTTQKITDMNKFCGNICDRICGPKANFCNSTCDYTNDRHEECVSYNVNCGMGWNSNKFCQILSNTSQQPDNNGAFAARRFLPEVYILYSLVIFKLIA